MRAVDGADWLYGRVSENASFAEAWEAFKAFIVMEIDEPEQYHERARWVDRDCDYLLFEGGERGMDIQRQLTHRDSDGEYAGMSSVTLSVALTSATEPVTLWGRAGTGPAPAVEPAFGEWVGGAAAWCAAAEATPALDAALSARTVDWSFWQSDI
jgi:hypothetical protein